MEKAPEVSCPICKVWPGIECTDISGHVMSPHPARLAKATLDKSLGPYVISNSGKRLYLIYPVPDAIEIEDIAHGLSNICRFHGQTRVFVSVAEHSMWVSDLVAPEYKLTALLHDAAEAYLGDVIQPLKSYIPVISSIEGRIMKIIANKFSLIYPFPQDVLDADITICAEEVKTYMAPGFYDERLESTLPISKEILDIPFGRRSAYHPLAEVTFSPKRAKEEFLQRFYRLTGGK